MPGIPEAVAELRALQERLADMTPIMRVVAADVQAIVDRSFRTSSSPDGVPWAPHSPTTTEMRARRRRGSSGQGRLLLDTGRLRASVTAQATRTGVVVGTNVAYARAQQFGNPRNRVYGKAPGPIPARPFLPVAPDGLTFRPASELERLRAIVERWLRTGEVSA